MNKTNIKDLPIEKPTNITIVEVRKSNMVIELKDEKYLISKPKTAEWNNIDAGMTVTVDMVSYGRDNQYMRLQVMSHDVVIKFTIPKAMMQLKTIEDGMATIEKMKELIKEFSRS